MEILGLRRTSSAPLVGPGSGQRRRARSRSLNLPSLGRAGRSLQDSGGPLLAGTPLGGLEASRESSHGSY